MALDQAVDAVGKSVDVAGILIIVVGAVAAGVRYLVGARGGRASEAYSLYRRKLGRAILLGLEFLEAGGPRSRSYRVPQRDLRRRAAGT